MKREAKHSKRAPVGPDCGRWALLGLVLGLVGSTGALAQPPAQGAVDASAVERALAAYEHEPSVGETTRRALRYFRVEPEAIDRLRSAARSRAWLPLLATGYRFDDDRTSRYERRDIFQPYELDENLGRRINSATVGMVWDLRELVFNPAEVQVYGLIGVQRDLMLEVTRTYFLRRQLQLRMALRPPREPLARAALQLRIEEFTAVLDVLTGGWFSEQVERRRGGRAR